MKKYVLILLAICVICSTAEITRAEDITLRKPTGDLYFTGDYFFSKQKGQPYDNDEVMAKVREVAAECRAQNLKNDVAIALWLHDWITHNANYDWEAYEHQEATGNIDGYEDSYTPRGVLLNGIGVCQSYAWAFDMLLDEFSIPNQEIISTEMNHMWSLVQFGGIWYHVDITWDDPGEGGHENHAYFGLSDVTISIDHKLDAGYPACPKNLVFADDETTQMPVMSMEANPALDVEFTCWNGKAYNLASFKNKKVIYVFANTGCGNTMYFLNQLTRYGDILKNQGIIVAVCMDPDDSMEDIKRYAEAYDSSFLIGRLKDDEVMWDINYMYYHYYGIPLPLIAVKDTQDNYVYCSHGFFEKAGELVSFVKKLPGSSDFEITKSAGGYVLTKYNGNARNLIIPSSIQSHGIYAIGAKVFKGNQDILSVEIQEGIKKIGSGCFQNSSVRDVYLPESLEEIGNSAFAGTTLASICIPKQTTLGTDVFAQSNLNTVIVYSGSPAEKYMKANYPQINLLYANSPEVAAERFLLFSRSGDHYIVSGYRGNPVDITVPQNYDGLPVTEIESYAFQNCPTLRTIVFSNGIEAINDKAFDHCSNLLTVDLPTSLKRIEYAAFENCFNLEYVSIPEGCKSIGYAAFEECYSLKSIVIPDSVTELGAEAFCGCRSLSEVHIGKGIRELKSTTFMNAVFTEFTIPDNVEVLGDMLFNSCYFLAVVHIPSSVKSIGENIFIYAYDNPIICCDEGSYAYKWAKKNHYTTMPYNSDPISYIKLPESVVAFVGMEQYFSPTYDGDGTDPSLFTWRSYSPDIINVAKDGKITAIESGEAVISVTCQNVTSYTEVTVYDQFDLSVFSSVITLPKGVTAVDREAFACTTAEAYVIQSPCRIRKEAFAHLTNVKLIVMPKKCVVEDGAFEGSTFVLMYK